MAAYETQGSNDRATASYFKPPGIETYPLSIFDNHLIVDIMGRQVLLDTGTPASIGRVPLFLLGATYNLQSSFMGLGIDAIAKYIGCTLDCIMGTDILKGLHFTIDYAQRFVTFSAQTVSTWGKPYPLETLLGVPIIPVIVGHQEVKMFLDTGAKITYLKKNLTAGCPMSGNVNDFYPGIGHFQTATYKTTVSVMGETVELKCGNLPPLIEIPLTMVGCAGIIGNDIFSYFNPISFNLPEKTACFLRRNVH
jgi:hypothetical protein